MFFSDGLPHIGPFLHSFLLFLIRVSCECAADGTRNLREDLYLVVRRINLMLVLHQSIAFLIGELCAMFLVLVNSFCTSLLIHTQYDDVLHDFGLKHYQKIVCQCTRWEY